MQINGLKGEFAFKALWKEKASPAGWQLSENYYLNLKSAEISYYSPGKITVEVKWPAEVYEDGTVYIPAEEEL